MNASLISRLALIASTVVIFSSAHAQYDPSQREDPKSICFITKFFDDHAKTLQAMRDKAGVVPGDDAETARAKVERLWKDPAAIGTPGEGLQCQRRSTMFQGTLLHVIFQKHQLEPERVLSLVEAGADINIIDAVTGNTLLDEVLVIATRNSGDRWRSPAARTWDLDRKFRDLYITFRKAGARHAAELAKQALTPEAAERTCLKQLPEDEPARFSDYRGGLNKNLNALTPKTVPGAKTVSVRQAACLMNVLEAQMNVWAVVRDAETLPGAEKKTILGGSGSFDDERQQLIEEHFTREKDRPTLVYCHHDSCFLSYNAALRLAHAGYTRIYWMRDGLKGWRDAGYPLALTERQ